MCATRWSCLRVAQLKCSVGLVEGIWCATGLGREGEGLGLRHFPASGAWASGISSEEGDLASFYSAFPTPLPRGPWQQLEKSSQSALRHSVFFCTPAIPYASKLATVCPGTKKALKRCLRAFFRCCGERGIRTPGTVTRTSV